MAMDAKLNFDDNASYRQQDVFALRDKTQEDPREVSPFFLLFYIIYIYIHLFILYIGKSSRF
jgi:hypothetical protein